MASNAHNPAYDIPLPEVERQRTFGAASEPAAKGRPAQKFGGKPPERTPTPMNDFFSRTKATPEEERALADDAAAPIEAEAEESVAEPEAEESEPAVTTEREAPAEPEAEDEGSRRVPLGELMAERERRKTLQAKIEQMEAAFQRVVDRVGQPAQQPAPVQPQPQIPAYEADPVGNLAMRLAQLEQGHGNVNQHVFQQQQIAQFQNALAGLESSFRAATPDYDQAVSFARAARDHELETLGYNLAQRQAIITQEIVGASAAAMDRGQNPAEMFYNFAKLKGWQTGGAPSAAAKESLPPPVVKPAAKLAAIAKGSASARSPRGGTAPATGVSLTDLAAMDDAEFDAHFDKLWRRT